MADLDRRVPDELGFGAAEHGAQRLVDTQEAAVEPDHGDAVGRVGERRLEHRAALTVGGLGGPPLAEILRPGHAMHRPAVAVQGGDRLGLGREHAAVQSHVLQRHPKMTLTTDLLDEAGDLVLPRRGHHGGAGPPHEVADAASVHCRERGVDRSDEPRRGVRDRYPARAPPERLLPDAAQLIELGADTDGM